MTAIDGPQDSQPDVTVLIPAFNADGFVKRSIFSALDQRDVSLEVLVVDDGSTDETAAVVTALADKDPRVRLLRMPRNKGPSAARNAGLDEALGRWVALLDADDALVPGRLGRLIAIGERADAGIVADNFRMYDARLDRVGKPGLARGFGVKSVCIYEFLFRARPNSDGADWGLLQPVLRRSLLMETGIRYPIDVRHGEDVLFMLQLLAAGAKFLLSDEPGYLYTARTSGWSRTQVDYEKMALDMEKLADLPTFSNDLRARRLILERGTAARRLGAGRRLRNHAGAGRFDSALREIFRSPVLLLDILRWIRKRVGPG